MALKTPEHIRIVSHGDDMIAAEWAEGSFKYHVWLVGGHWMSDVGKVIYKNPIKGTPDYARIERSGRSMTSKLDITKHPKVLAKLAEFTAEDHEKAHAERRLAEKEEDARQETMRVARERRAFEEWFDTQPKDGRVKGISPQGEAAWQGWLARSKIPPSTLIG